MHRALIIFPQATLKMHITVSLLRWATTRRQHVSNLSNINEIDWPAVNEETINDAADNGAVYQTAHLQNRRYKVIKLQHWPLAVHGQMLGKMLNALNRELKLFRIHYTSYSFDVYRSSKGQKPKDTSHVT